MPLKLISNGQMTASPNRGTIYTGDVSIPTGTTQFSLPIVYNAEKNGYGFYADDRFYKIADRNPYGDLIMQLAVGGQWVYSSINYVKYTNLTLIVVEYGVTKIIEILSADVPTINDYLTVGQYKGVNINITKNPSGLLGLSLNSSINLEKPIELYGI